MKGFGHNISKKSSKYSIVKQKLINEALAYQNQGNLNLAAKCYENIIQRGLEDNNLLLNYGIILFQLGYVEKAITLFKGLLSKFII